MTRIRDVMTKNVIKAGRKTTITEICRTMVRHKIGSIIVSEAEEPVGIITERDILEKIAVESRNPDNVTAEDIMTKNLVTVKADVPIEEAVKLLAEKRLKRLPVVEGSKLIGIVTATDILRAVNTDMQSKLLDLYRREAW